MLHLTKPGATVVGITTVWTLVYACKMGIDKEQRKHFFLNAHLCETTYRHTLGGTHNDVVIQDPKMHMI